MSAHPPPVPPQNRSPKGPGEPADTPKGGRPEAHAGKAPANPGEQGQQGNTKQNTTNQGYQQDR
ncbi:MAG TPA: hypothetical protein VE650_10035 [Acetobacteraceae bacterium]|jgi:hypothetical protein|nr:hypothetical protein [Acetobacteraceae bacterium]